MSITSTEMVVRKLPFPENAVICQGYFPDTTKSVPENNYAFVNLDFDLYQPILAGLRYFYPRMVRDGVILIHDFFNPGYPGVEKAVVEFATENGNNIPLLPIGDNYSIAIIKWK